MKFKNLTELSNYCECTSMGKLVYYRKMGKLELPKRIGDQYTGYIDVSQDIIDNIKKLNKINKKQWDILTKMKLYGTTKRRKKYTRIAKDINEIDGNEWARDLERRVKENMA